MFNSTNPATGEVFAEHPELTDAEVEARLAKAATFYREWRATSYETRTALLAKIADAFEADKHALAEMAVREMGKTLQSAIAEVEKSVSGFRYYAEHGPALLSDTEVTIASGKAIARWLPMGPVLAIMPWNFPYWQVVRFLAPTIMAGNVGLLKHASLTQGVAGLIEATVLKAGAPDGLFQNLAITSGKVDPIIADDRIVAVTLTGSEGAGVKVAEAAGRNLKKVVLELGGSDPFIVMPSADIAKAAEVAVTARTQNAGQLCICAKRMIVHADIYDQFLELFVKGMKELKIGDPMTDGVAMGPLSSVEQRDTVLDQIEEAKTEGATLLFGGEKLDRSGAWMTAGVLTDIPPEGNFAKQEIFGPVAMVFKAKDIDDAITLANDVPFGLGSSVWDQRCCRAGAVRSRDRGGHDRDQRDAGIGSGSAVRWRQRSGHGRELGPWGLHEFMNLKAVMLP